MLPLFLSAGCFVYYYLLPSSGISKTARSVISVILLSSVCICLFNSFDGNADFSFTDPGDEETDIYQPYDFYEDSAKKLVEQTVSDIILKYTNVPFSQKVDVRRKDEGTIEILHVSVIFDVMPEHRKEMTEELLKEIGIIPEFREKDKNE